MSNFLIFSGSAVLDYLTNQDDPYFINRADAIKNPDLSSVSGLDRKYWKVSNGLVVAMDNGEKAAVDAAEAAAILAAQRTAAQAILSSPSDLGKLIRASDDVVLSEINTLRQWLVSFKAAVAGAATLAALKTAVAALPDMPDRTLAQAKTAILNELSAGTID